MAWKILCPFEKGSLSLADKDKRKILITIFTAGTLSSTATKESADIQIYKLDKYFMSFWAGSVQARTSRSTG